MEVYDHPFLGMTAPKVHVYRNLSKGCWSIKHQGLVVAHGETLLLRGASFSVSETGRQRVLTQGRKNVHAYVSGLLDWLYVTHENAIRHVLPMRGHYVEPKDVQPPILKNAREAIYNPYHYKTFVFADDQSVAETQDGDYVMLDHMRRVWVGQL